MPSSSSRASATRADRRRAAVQRRRQQVSARTAAARQVARRRRRLRVVGGLVAVAVVGGTGLGLTLAESGGGTKAPQPTLRASLVKGAAGPLDMSAVPAAYHAVYRAESYDGSKVTSSTEDLSVRRPFDGRVTIREGTTPAGAVQFDGRSTLGSYANSTGSEPGQVSGDAPAVAFGDVRVGPELADLLDRGLFVLKERRTALGRDCQVYRTGSPLQSLKITAPTATDYADACLDAAGLVLEEVTVVGGKLTQRLTATELVDDATFEAATFTVDGTPVGFDQGGSVLTPIDADVAPGPGYWQLDTPPAGFERKGRYRLQTADPAAPTGPPVTAYVDLYVASNDLVLVRQGPRAGEPDGSSTSSPGETGRGGPARDGAGHAVDDRPDRRRPSDRRRLRPGQRHLAGKPAPGRRPRSPPSLTRVHARRSAHP